MKFRLSLIVLLLTQSVYGQDADSLKKYSYFVSGFSFDTAKPAYISGTVFFIRKGGFIYLVTAKHVLIGCNGSGSDETLPKQINIWTVFSDSEIKVEPIDLTGIRKLIPCSPTIYDTDIVVLQGKDIGSFKRVNSVENFLIPPIEKFKRAEIWGFPSGNNFFNGYFRYAPASNLSIKDIDLIVTHSTDTISKKTDSIAFRIYSKSLVIDSTNKGYSGSPVFLQDSETKKWRVIGLLAAVAVDSNHDKFYRVPKVEYILKILENFR